MPTASDLLFYEVDSYKIGHNQMYPTNLTTQYAYLEARAGQETVFFGLLPLLEDLADEFVVPSPEDIRFAQDFFGRHFGTSKVFDPKPWEALWTKYRDRLPLRICAIPEGMVTPTRNVLLTVENTDPEFAWLPTLVETFILNRLWYPITIASQSHTIRKELAGYFERTIDGDYQAALDFAVHDFGFRGCATPDQAAIGGAAHLISFKGTDTIGALRFVQKFYADSDYMAGFSVPAMEHSVVQAFATEQEAYTHTLKAFPSGIVSCVSDTYDYFNALDNVWGQDLYDEVMKRDGTVVFRPDSGKDPIAVIKESLLIAANRFGVTMNNKGYKVLDRHVKFIYGDGMTPTSIPAMYKAITEAGWSAVNLVVGSGGGLLQKVNRDTYSLAYKVAEDRYSDGTVRETQKRPLGDKTKWSMKGRLALVEHEGTFETVTETPNVANLLAPVFENGRIADHVYTDFSTIRARARNLTR